MVKRHWLVLGVLAYSDLLFDAYFLRTSDQREIDLVIEFGSSLGAFEIKLTTKPGPADMGRLNTNADLIEADKRFLVSQNKKLIETNGQIACNLQSLIEYIEKAGARNRTVN